MGLPILNMDGYLLKRIKQNTADLTQETADRTAADLALQKSIEDLRLAGISSLTLTSDNSTLEEATDISMPVERVGNTYIAKMAFNVDYNVGIGNKAYGCVVCDVRDWSSRTNFGTSVCNFYASIQLEFETRGSTTTYFRSPDSVYFRTGGTGYANLFTSGAIYSNLILYTPEITSIRANLYCCIDYKMTDGDTLYNAIGDTLTLKTQVCHINLSE